MARIYAVSAAGDKLVQALQVRTVEWVEAGCPDHGLECKRMWAAKKLLRKYIAELEQNQACRLIETPMTVRADEFSVGEVLDVYLVVSTGKSVYQGQVIIVGLTKKLIRTEDSERIIREFYRKSLNVAGVGFFASQWLCVRKKGTPA